MSGAGRPRRNSRLASRPRPHEFCRGTCPVCGECMTCGSCICDDDEAVLVDSPCPRAQWGDEPGPVSLS